MRFLWVSSCVDTGMQILEHMFMWQCFLNVSFCVKQMQIANNTNCFKTHVGEALLCLCVSSLLSLSFDIFLCPCVLIFGCVLVFWYSVVSLCFDIQMQIVKHMGGQEPQLPLRDLGWSQPQTHQPLNCVLIYTLYIKYIHIHITRDIQYTYISIYIQYPHRLVTASDTPATQLCPHIYIIQKVHIYSNIHKYTNILIGWSHQRLRHSNQSTVPASVFDPYIHKQARKPRSYASPKLCPLTYLMTYWQG